jgi:hypothetical protein
MHIGTTATPSKPTAVSFLPPWQTYSDLDTLRQDALNKKVNPVGFIDFTT